MVLSLIILIIALAIFFIFRLVKHEKKGIAVILIIGLVIVIDQTLKIWIKTNYPHGQVMNIAGQQWARLYFIENKGMAWGMELGGNWGKMLLTLFRLAAVTFGSWYLLRIIREGYSKGFIVCAALIYAGALGNLIDSMFYGLIFTESDYTKVAQIFPKGGGYGGFLHGQVVDMLYFPMIKSTFPSWVPFLGDKPGDRDFEFFSPIFNIADASISVGVITLLLFQKRFLHKKGVVVSPDERKEDISVEEAKQMI